MFLAAVGVPRYNPNDPSQFFDGKIGIWPFANMIAAEKGSRNRPKGTMEVKELSVTQEVFFEYMTKPNGVLEAIKQVSDITYYMTFRSLILVFSL